MVTPVLALTTREPLDWGLDLARLRLPATILVPPAPANPLAGRDWPAGLRLLTLNPDDDPASAAGRVRLLARCADSGSDDDLWVWVDAMYAASLFPLEVLYSDLFAERIVADRGECPFMYGHHGYPANPVIIVMTRRELAVAAAAGDQILAETFDPYPPVPAMEGVMPVDLAHLAHRPSVHFLRGRTEPVVHIIGDSHSLFCFTPCTAIGSRSDILVDRRDVTPLPVPFRWQFTHHRGAVTMYRVGRDAEEIGPRSLAEIDVRDGDAMVFVFGEIDVRCHVMKQHQAQGRPVGEIVERLAGAYMDRLVDVATRFPRSAIAVFGVIPPFDPPNYGPANPPIVGTLDERVAAARMLNQALERRAAAEGLIYFDVMNDLAGPDGSLPHERSDHFCHVSFAWAHLSLNKLYERLAEGTRTPLRETTEDVADLTLHHMGRTGVKPRLVVIGAMDGVSYDEFVGYYMGYEWPGLFVEPIPSQFQRLRAHYEPLEFAAANRYEMSAIAEHDGTVEMLTIDQRAVDERRVDACFGGMSAIDPPRNGLGSAYDAATVAEYGRRITVPCLTLRTLLERHEVAHVDLLAIDAEGWDFRILRQLDFSRHRPRLIRCEYINLPPDEQAAIRDLLSAQGYVIRLFGQNIDAVPAEYWQEVMAGRPNG